MRYADIRGITAEIDKRKGKNVKRLQKRLSAASSQPPATPARPKTDGRYDQQGNVYTQHKGHSKLREIRRANKFGRGGEAPLRSRVQRQSRRRKTGGVR